MKNIGLFEAKTKLKRLNLTEAEISALEELLSDVRTDWPNAKFKLFGSKVNGIADYESDLDLLILLPCSVEEDIRQKIIHKVFDINLYYESNISILILSEKEWNNSPISLLPIHAVIKKEGISL